MISKGIHYKLTNAEYHDDEAVSRSYLKNLDIPAKAKVEFNSNSGMSIGSAAHVAILEPHLYSDMVIEASCKTTNAKEYKNLVEQYPDHIILTAGGTELINQMSEAMLIHPMAKALLSDKNNIAEPSIFWQDEDTGIMCKTRPDIMNPEKKIFIDLKFVREGYSAEQKFKWYVRDHGYDLQVAMNIWGMKKASGVLYEDFWFIVVETSEPFVTACYRLDEEDISTAMFNFKALLKREKQCRENNLWPNYRDENAEGETLYMF